MAIAKWMDKEDAVCIYNGILLSRKNATIPLAATWVDLEFSMWSEALPPKIILLAWTTLTSNDDCQLCDSNVNHTLPMTSQDRGILVPSPTH